MRLRQINEGRDGAFIVPDTIADWDAPSHWERERLDSMRLNLHPGMTLVDVGVEHGWMSAVYGRHVGYQNMILCEPGPEMWQDIRLIWEHNGFPMPRLIWPGFVGAETDVTRRMGLDEFGEAIHSWPSWTSSDGPESPPMAYRTLSEEGHRERIPTATIDFLRPGPIDAITIDVEGAELEVMRGATYVLAHDRPLVWISEHPDLMLRDFDYGMDELHAFMREAGYLREFIHTDHEDHTLYRPL